MELADGTPKASIPASTQDFCAVRKILSQIGAQVYYDENPQLYNKHPIELIVKAHSKNNYIGSATMVVLTLDDMQLRGCYIGGTFSSIKDSGFIVIRVIYSKPMIIYQFS